jgi:predicted nucleic acid-binding Zn ribbon protein
MPSDRSTLDEHDEVCEDCGSELHLRQSWTGQAYTLCPNCNSK